MLRYVVRFSLARAVLVHIQRSAQIKVIHNMNTAIMYADGGRAIDSMPVGLLYAP